MRSPTLTDNELGAILKRVVWDYAITPEQLVHIFKGHQQVPSLDRATLHARLLNGYAWHQLIRWFGFETTRSFLREETIIKVFPPSYRRKLTYAQRVLQE